MVGLVLRATEQSRESAEFAVELDSTEPYLNDHRPGGYPLFGTVMGLELMARSVAKIAGCPPSTLTNVAHLLVREPIIVRTASTTAFVRVVRSYLKSGETFQCEVVTRGATVVPHFSATLRLAMPTSHTPAVSVPTVDSPLPVQASDVYALFFHGSTFQVIQRAGLVHHDVVAEVASRLPALTSDPHDTNVLAPQLIEACLQTAGLLEIATRSRMMIPSRIDSIKFFVDHASVPRGLFTRARRSITHDGADAVDIDVFDLDGACWLTVCGYETLPLPFPSDSTAIGNLRNSFHRETWSDK